MNVLKKLVTFLSTKAEEYPMGPHFIQLKLILVHFASLKFWHYLVQVLVRSISKTSKLFSFCVVLVQNIFLLLLNKNNYFSARCSLGY